MRHGQLKLPNKNVFRSRLNCELFVADVLTLA